MMRNSLLAAAACLLVASAANAGKFDFSYTLPDGNVVSGVLDGTVSGDLFDITDYESLTLNGATVGGAHLPVISTDSRYDGQSTLPSLKLDGSFIDFAFYSTDGADILAFAVDDGTAAIITQTDAVGATTSLGGTGFFETFVPGNYAGHLEASVPEPASWAMMLGGFGLIGGAMRSRRRAVVSFG